jgi:hypothetical protein
MKCATIVIALLAAFALPAMGQNLTPHEARVAFSFTGTQASPRAQIIFYSGSTWWWGIADDTASGSLVPGEYAVQTDDGSSDYHVAYFQLTDGNGVPAVVKYHVYALSSSCDVHKPASFGCSLGAGDKEGTQ